MKPTDKLSTAIAANYLGITYDAVKSLWQTGFLKAFDTVGANTPVFLRSELDRFKETKPKDPIDEVQEEIRQQRTNLQNLIHKYSVELESLRARCTHPKVQKTPKSNTGNWDRGDDSYWYECLCRDCTKRWTEPQ